MKIINDFDALFSDAAARYGVPFTWAKAVAGAESDWIPTAFRAEPQINDGSYGLMQVLLRTARGLGYKGDAVGLYDPATNIDLGVKLLGEHIQRYGMDFSAVYSAYNSGSGTAYKTNPTVAAHVNRAITYLNAVIAATPLGPDESEAGPVDDTGAAGQEGTSDTGAVLGITGAALALAIAAGLYFLTRH